MPAAAFLAVALAAAPACAAAPAFADWTEPPYDPPVGSRWIIQRDLDTEENYDGAINRSTFRITSELRIEAKPPTGFRPSTGH